MNKRFSSITQHGQQWLAGALLVTLLGHTSLWAQTIAVQQEKTSKTTEVTIPDGTEFAVVTTEELSSKSSVEGDPVTFKVKEDVVINGQVILAKDAIVKGIISNSEKSGRFGKGGKLNIRVESATAVDGQKVKLRATKSGKGGDKTGTTVALVVLFGPLGFLKKGKDAKVLAGTEIKVYTDEEKKVQVTIKN